MAELHNPHYGEPVNDYERIVVARLVEDLPDDYVVIPCVEIDGMEIDAIVVSPHAVVLVEVKGFRPERRVIFAEHEHRVDSEVRPAPQNGLRLKAKRIKSRLVRRQPSLSGVWVSGQVVMPEPPNFLEIASEIKHEVCALADAVERFVQPNLIIRDGFDADRVDMDGVLEALGLLQRRRPVERFGDYETEALVGEFLGGRTYAARSLVSGQMVLLLV